MAALRTMAGWPGAGRFKRSPRRRPASHTPPTGTRESDVEAVVTSRCCRALKKSSMEAPYMKNARNRNAAQLLPSKERKLRQWKGSAQIKRGILATEAVT